MLAGNRTAHLHAPGDDFLCRLHHHLGLAFVSSVKHEERVEIAVPRVKNVSDAQVVPAANFFDVFEHLRQTGARDHSVLHVEIGADPSEGAEGVFPPAPKKITLFR